MSNHRLSNNEQDMNTFTTFEDVEVPDALREQISFNGAPELDLIFAGEGIRPSTVTLWTGLPGAGKTTTCLSAASSLAAAGHTVLYVACEESREQLKMNVERMGLEGINKVFVANISEVSKIIAYATRLRAAKLKAGKHFFVFVDSLQTIEVASEEGKRGRKPSQETQAVQAAWMLAAWAKDVATPDVDAKRFAQVFLIGQVTKDGTFAGKQELKHAIDVHLHMGIDTDKNSPMKGERFMEMEKNRFGLTGVPYYYRTVKAGIEFVEVADAADDEE